VSAVFLHPPLPGLTVIDGDVDDALADRTVHVGLRAVPAREDRSGFVIRPDDAHT
jgi:hypothetical protein